MPQYRSLNPVSGISPAASSSPTGFTPQQIRQAYGFDQVRFANGIQADGAGTTIAIVDAYDDPNITTDLHQFDLAFGLPDPVLTKVNQNGGASLPAANSGWITEIALDVEWAHAIAPAARILLVEASSNSEADLFTAVDYARRATGVVAVSMSWDGDEFTSETDYDSFFTTPAGHQGVSFVVASGDNGAPVSYPSASPNVLSVGGTRLATTAGNYANESGWSGSGGGVSAFETQPQYQQGKVTQSTSSRTNPDVAYDADPYTGFPVYDSYNNGTVTPWGQWGGTSDAAPQWSALIAIADQGRAAVGLSSLDGSTELLPALYRIPNADFHDVTTGVSTGSPNYSANPGYDLVTGRGTPQANLIIPALIGKSDPTVATHFAISAPATVVPGATFTVTVTALNSDGETCPDYRGTIQFSSTDPSIKTVLPTDYSFAASDAGVHTFSGLVLISAGNETVSVKDSLSGFIFGTANLSVINSHSIPTLSGSRSLSYVKNQTATPINTTIIVADSGHATLSLAKVAVTNFVANEDVLSFVNDSSSRFGNITSIYDSTTGLLTLSSTGATATIAQFQSALRSVTYFNRSGMSASLGTRLITYQVSNGTNVSQLLTSYVRLSNPTTSSSITSSAQSIVFGQQVMLTARIVVLSPGKGTPTGGIGNSKVNFFDGDSSISGEVFYQSVNGTLIATLTTPNFGAGIHQIHCVYSGDANNLGCASSTTELTVFHAGTIASVVSSNASALIGQAVTFDAIIQVVSPGKGTPTAGAGSAKVTFMDGTYALPGTVSYSVVNGNLMASLAVANLSAGIHSVTAVYSRDANFLDSTTASLKQSVVLLTPTASMNSSNRSSVFGQAVTLTAAIGAANPSSGIPSGSVVFLDYGVRIAGTIAEHIENGELIAVLTTSTLAPGNHAISAVYGGDLKFRSVTSVFISQVVSRLSTTASVSSSLANGILGQPMTLTAAIAVAGSDTRFLTPSSGAVSFLDGSQVLSGNVAYRSVDGNLIATLVTNKLSFGTHQISAQFAGNSALQGSISPHHSVAVLRIATTSVVSTSTASPVFGQPVTLTATIRAIGMGIEFPDTTPPNATVKFYDSNMLIRGSVTYHVVSGNLIAMLTTNRLTPGIHSLSAMFVGDSRWIGSTSPAVQQTVFHAATTNDISVSATTTVVGQPITLSATIASVASGTGVPTAGTGSAHVTFLDGNRVISGVVVYSVVHGKLIATLTTTALLRGIHSLSASYSHDANFLDSVSRSIRLTIV